MNQKFITYHWKDYLVCSNTNVFMFSTGKCCQRREKIFREAPLWETGHTRTHTQTSTHTYRHTNTHFAQAYTEEPTASFSAVLTSRSCPDTSCVRKPQPSPLSIKHLLRCGRAPEGPGSRQDTHRWPHCCHATPFPREEQEEWKEGRKRRTDDPFPSLSLIAKTLIEISPTTYF